MKKIKLKRKAQSGFSLLEMLVAVALLGTLLSFAVPVFSDYTERQAIISDVQRFKSLLTSARSLAMTSNAGASLVCWNPTANAADVEGNTVPAQTLATFSFTATSPAVAQIESAQSIVEDQNTYSSNEGASGCIGFDSQGRLTDANNATVEIRVCREAGNSDDSRRLEILGTGRIAIRDNTNC